MAKTPTLMRRAEREWWAGDWTAQQTRVMVFQTAMNTTRSTQDAQRTIGSNYMQSDKGLWDGEPNLLIRAIEQHDLTFFRSFPAEDGVELRAAMGRAAKAFYGHGLPKHEKLNLGKVAPLLEAI